VLGEDLVRAESSRKLNHGIGVSPSSSFTPTPSTFWTRAVATADSPQRSLLQERLNEITQQLAIGDSWHTMIGTLDDPGAIISEKDERVTLYLSNIMMLWRLGVKPATYEEITTSRSVLRPGQSDGPDGVGVDPLA
jgi:hypothetical protein